MEDGKPFSAHDVMYTYKVTVDPRTPTPYSGDFKLVTKAEVLDDHTFRVTYDKPFAPALISWSASIMPRHLLEGKDITTSPLKRKPVGTGPYIFTEWSPATGHPHRESALLRREALHRTVHDEDHPRYGHHVP
jgi:peptide/nickel transport system substrate-binding protein